PVRLEGGGLRDELRGHPPARPRQRAHARRAGRLGRGPAPRGAGAYHRVVPRPTGLSAGMAAGRVWAAVAVAALLVVYLGRIGGFPLQDPDEGRYAEIPREMVESGDWLTPRLNYVKYYEKPPLLYWLIATSFVAFGPEEWAGRLIPVLAGLATIAMTLALGAAALGSRAAWLAAAVLATSPLFFGLSQAILIDMVLTACTTATLGALWFAQTAERREVKDRWVLVAAVGAGLRVVQEG